MKSPFFSALASLALVSGAFAQLAPRPGDVRIEKITPTIVKTPDFSLATGGLKRFKAADWLEVEVEFQSAPELIDELTFSYKILIGGKLLTGEVTHVDIPKGKEHYSVAYVSPRALELLTGGKPITPNAITIWVDASKQGQKLAELSSQRVAVPNVPQLAGKVLNKSQTPFAPLYWDRYEALKAPSR